MNNVSGIPIPNSNNRHFNINPKKKRSTSTSTSTSVQNLDSNKKTNINLNDYVSIVDGCINQHTQKYIDNFTIEFRAVEILTSPNINKLTPFFDIVQKIFFNYCYSLYKSADREFKEIALLSFEKEFRETIENFTNPDLFKSVNAIYVEIMQHHNQIAPCLKILKKYEPLTGPAYIKRIFQKACDVQRSKINRSALTLEEMGYQITYFLECLQLQNKLSLKQKGIFTSVDFLWLFNEFEIENLGYMDKNITGQTNLEEIKIHRKTEILSAAKNLLNTVELWQKNQIL